MRSRSASIVVLRSGSGVRATCPDRILFRFRASAAGWAYFTGRSHLLPAIPGSDGTESKDHDQGRDAKVVTATKGPKRTFYIILAARCRRRDRDAPVSWPTPEREEPDHRPRSQPSAGDVGGLRDGQSDGADRDHRVRRLRVPRVRPVCELTEPDIRTQYVNTGKIRFRFIDLPLSIRTRTRSMRPTRRRAPTSRGSSGRCTT